MKTLIGSVIGASALCICTSAPAQTSVTLYGVADGNVRFDHTNIGTLRSVGSGGESGTRWGLRGTEDLGNGLKATFIFEQGFNLDDNAVFQGNVGAGASGGYYGSSTAPHSSTGSRLFSRLSTVGLAGPFGEIRFGRSYHPLHLVQATADPYGAATVGEASNVFILNTLRNDNAVYYDTPRVWGLQASAVYQMGESTTNSPSVTTTGATGQAKRGNDRIGAGFTYTNGPIFAGVGYEGIKSNLSTFKTNTWDAIYWQTRSGISPFLATANLKEKSYFVGATVPFGAWTFLGGYGRLRDQSTSSLATVDLGTPRANFFSAALKYSLSKRTVLYAVGSRFNLRKGPNGNAFQGFVGITDTNGVGLYNTANLTGTAGVNVNPYSYQFGLRHAF